MGKWSDLHSKVLRVLRPKGDPIGFKLFRSEEEAKKLGGFTKTYIALCQAINIPETMVSTS